MRKAIIIGASGYTGAELALILHRHPQFTLDGLYVSSQSADAKRPISDLYPQLKQRVDLPLQPLPADQEGLRALARQADTVFLATAHEVSHELVPVFFGRRLPSF